MQLKSGNRFLNNLARVYTPFSYLVSMYDFLPLFSTRNKLYNRSYSYCSPATILIKEVRKAHLSYTCYAPSILQMSERYNKAAYSRYGDKQLCCIVLLFTVHLIPCYLRSTLTNQLPLLQLHNIMPGRILERP